MKASTVKGRSVRLRLFALAATLQESANTYCTVNRYCSSAHMWSCLISAYINISLHFTASVWSHSVAAHSDGGKDALVCGSGWEGGVWSQTVEAAPPEQGQGDLLNNTAGGAEEAAGGSEHAHSQQEGRDVHAHSHLCSYTCIYLKWMNESPVFHWLWIRLPVWGNSLHWLCNQQAFIACFFWQTSRFFLGFIRRRRTSQPGEDRPAEEEGWRTRAAPCTERSGTGKQSKRYLCLYLLYKGNEMYSLLMLFHLVQ